MPTSALISALNIRQHTAQSPDSLREMCDSEPAWCFYPSAAIDSIVIDASRRYLANQLTIIRYDRSLLGELNPIHNRFRKSLLS